MKKAITQEVAICEAPDCGERCSQYGRCLRCGKDFCNAHKKEYGVTYWNAAGAGAIASFLFYCTPCDVELSESGADSLHRALVAIRNLRGEWDAFVKDYKLRARELDAALNHELPEHLRFGRVR